MNVAATSASFPALSRSVLPTAETRASPAAPATASPFAASLADPITNPLAGAGFVAPDAGAATHAGLAGAPPANMATTWGLLPYICFRLEKLKLLGSTIRELQFNLSGTPYCQLGELLASSEVLTFSQTFIHPMTDNPASDRNLMILRIDTIFQGFCDLISRKGIFAEIDCSVTISSSSTNPLGEPTLNTKRLDLHTSGYVNTPAHDRMIFGLPLTARELNRFTIMGLDLAVSPSHLERYL